ncbi:hypothetical protein [Effusibacillus lacus]|uniref:Glycosyltransferase subfamily 4-like N-terminal domain-containing protein n=1 Tax=Effusibacillus lacus TaxID=1348429 RepID=A0A292YS68_9BACL|nr:hypothetical protein [Effusibacillus lacus]TCS76998.1 hypothetical protein EDD64_101222 [Effusibacillus lacus]GAX91325.1 hypothetical protein EFBL_2991 [Effusibacillus lacus]
MERILMVSYFAPPILSAESILVGKILPELARYYKIELVAAGEDVDFRKDETLAEIMQSENIEIHRYNNPKPLNKIVRRLYQKGSSLFQDVNAKWMEQVLLRHKLTGPYKLIYSRSMPGISHLAAYEFKQKLGIPWVAQFSDPWAHNPYHQYPLDLMHQVENKNESKVIQAADRFIFPTVEIRDLVASHYKDVNVKGISMVLPHYYVDRLYHDNRSGENGNVRSESAAGGHKAPIAVAYIGDFYGLRSPEPLLRALEVVERQAPEVAERMRLRIIGNVDWRHQPLFDEYLPKVRVTVERVGQVPYLQSLAEMRKSDILLLIDAPSDVNLFLPSKLIDYFGARKPIMGITSEKGTTGRLIRKFGFPVVDPREPEKVAGELIRMAQNLDRYQKLADENDTDMFTAESVAEELVRLFQQL